MITKQLYEAPATEIVELKTESGILTVLSGNGPAKITNIIGGEDGEEW